MKKAFTYFLLGLFLLLPISNSDAKRPKSSTLRKPTKISKKDRAKRLKEAKKISSNSKKNYKKIKPFKLKECIQSKTIKGSKITPPDEGVYLGISTNQTPLELRQMLSPDGIKLGKNHPIYSLYVAWGEASELNIGRFHRIQPAEWPENSIIHLAWKPQFNSLPAHSLKQIRPQKITRGDYDWYIRDTARKIAKWGKPMFLRFAWEFNLQEGAAYNAFYSNRNASHYVNMWRHVHNIFVREGATNVTWVWLMNDEGIPDKMWNQADLYYPGDDCVDWVGVDTYNFGIIEGLEGVSWIGEWRTFYNMLTRGDPLFMQPYNYLVSRYPNKPIFIGEFGSDEHGGNKAAWIRDAFALIPRFFKKIKAIAYFSINPNPPYSAFGRSRDWRIETSQSSLDAYREAISDPLYLSSIDIEVPSNPRGIYELATFEPGWNKDSLEANSGGHHVECEELSNIETVTGDGALGSQQSAMISFGTRPQGCWAHVQKANRTTYFDYADYITFWIKGETNSEGSTARLLLIESWPSEKEPNEEVIEEFHYDFSWAGNSWQKLVIPLRSFTISATHWTHMNGIMNRDHLKYIKFTSTNSQQISFKVDQIQLEMEHHQLSK